MRSFFRKLAVPVLWIGLIPVHAQDSQPPGQDSGETKKASPAKQPKTINHAEVVRALHMGQVDKFLELTAEDEAGQYSDLRADILQRRGEQRFFAADIAGSIADFDEVIAIDPKRDPYHWQRGISYYYADEFQKGKEQFERHQTVNSQDVENAVWHFLCSIRAPGGSLESAQSNLIPITGDTRVPMKQIHDLFAGKGSREEVLKAAQAEGNPAKSDQARNALMYAHLYLAIYHEALGELDQMKQHITKAAKEYRMDHYMGQVAQVHAKLRGIDLATE